MQMMPQAEWIGGVGLGAGGLGPGVVGGGLVTMALGPGALRWWVGNHGFGAGRTWMVAW